MLAQKVQACILYMLVEIETMKKTNLIKKRISAGKKGGLKTIEKHGKEHLSKIAKDKWINYRKSKNHERKNKNNKQKN